jgi:hypothetical protein
MLISRAFAFASRSPITETILEPAVLDSSKALSESSPDALYILMCAFHDFHMARSSYLSLIYSDSPNIQVDLDGRGTREAHSHRA